MLNGRRCDYIIVDDFSYSMREVAIKLALEAAAARMEYAVADALAKGAPKNQPYGPQKITRKGKVKKY